jgi:hypothetical protein
MSEDHRASPSTHTSSKHKSGKSHKHKSSKHRDGERESRTADDRDAKKESRKRDSSRDDEQRAVPNTRERDRSRSPARSEPREPALSVPAAAAASSAKAAASTTTTNTSAPFQFSKTHSVYGAAANSASAAAATRGAPAQVVNTSASTMIEVVCNDRLGKKVRVKANSDDTIGDLEEDSRGADWHAAREDSLAKVVQRLQRPYHVARLRSSRWIRI